MWTDFELWIGAELVDNKGNVLHVEQIFRETLNNESVKVYNFKVDEYHTYFVDKSILLVHNSQCIGEHGTQTSSKTIWKNGKTERIDVENLAPGVRDGNIHYHDSCNKKYYYDIETKTFFDAKTGAVAPKKVQNLLLNKNFSNGIKKGLKILGD